jgi:hypothetical protein
MKEALCSLPMHTMCWLRPLCEKAQALDWYGTGPVSSPIVVDPGRSLPPCSSNVDHFFETVSDECRHKRISDFIGATGTAAIATAICAVCAGF